MDGIVLPDRVPLAGYMQDLALLWVERHQPIFFPLLKLVQIFLQLDGIFHCYNRPVQDTVVSE